MADCTRQLCCQPIYLLNCPGLPPDLTPPQIPFSYTLYMFNLKDSSEISANLPLVCQMKPVSLQPARIGKKAKPKETAIKSTHLTRRSSFKKHNIYQIINKAPKVKFII